MLTDWDLGMMDLGDIKKIFKVIYHKEGQLRFCGTAILDDKVQWEVMAKGKGKPQSPMIQKLGD